MARVARHQLHETCLQPGTLYHITNRGAGRRNIFCSPRDRLVFLSALANACRRYGLLVHTYCLMSNHIHLLVEDVRGCLSQAMSLTQSVYARYFNDSRSERGAGHLFGDRFSCEVISSAHYYDRIVSYILLNPLRCATPLAASAEDYTWSSAALHISSLAPGAFFAHLLEQYGGAEALLASLPRPSTPEVTRNRRARFDALVSGEWMSPDAARFGRSPSQMRDMLRSRTLMSRPEPASDIDEGDCAVPTNRGIDTHAIPRAAAAFAGVTLATVFASLQDECASGVPAGDLTCDQVVAYLSWRFCSTSLRQIASALGWIVDKVSRTVASVRRLRAAMPAWETVLWRLEWRLRWRLACGPHRA